MIVIPAMDLMGGSAVRLRQGRFDDSTVYPAPPAEALRAFADAGARLAHIVDLDGARRGEPVQHELIANLAAGSSLRLQVGGGIRSSEQIAFLLDSGVERVVVGSLAVRQPQTVAGWLERFGPDRIVLAIDVRMQNEQPMVAVSGWSSDSGQSLWDVAANFPSARHLLLTDIDRDGMLGGPNVALLDDAVARLPHLDVQASGGVASLDDLRRLPTASAIVGKAIWEGRFTVEEAVRNASG